MKRNLLLTFDYELFLGPRSGRIDACLLKPTDGLLRLLARHGVKGIFFIDVLYLIRLKAQRDERCRHDFGLVAGQLRRMVSGGHDVFPHLHPHWLDAGYDGAVNEWNLGSAGKYRFHRCSEAERTRLFDEAMATLRDILAPGYRPDGYRAGGWSIQPFSDFRPHFLRHGIRYDMTVLPGMYSFTDAQHFDFTTAPAKSIYRFDGDVCFEVPNGPFVEFTLSQAAMPRPGLRDRLWNAWNHQIVRGRGQGYRSVPLADAPEPAGPGTDMSSGMSERLAVELLSPFRLRAYRRFLHDHAYVHFISHPKMITRSHLACFSLFLKEASRAYELETDFRTMVPPIPAA